MHPAAGEPTSLTTPWHRRAWALLRHAWQDDRRARRLLGPDTQERLRSHIARSESRHSGEIRVIVEATLPASYLWRHLRQDVPLSELVHQRALMQFSKARVWDTALNNGVLLYALLAERRLELVADRGIDAHVGSAGWTSVMAPLAAHFARDEVEAGLLEAIDAVSAHLERHFPLAAGQANPNELPDAPELL